MKYVYSVVRFVPDPVRAESVNVGILIGSDESLEWDFRIIGTPRRAKALDHRNVWPAVLRFLDEIGTRVDRHSDAVQAGLFDDEGARLSEAWLARLATDSQNVVQFSPPAPIAHDDLAAALETIYDQFIVELEARRFPFKKKTFAQTAVRRVLLGAGLKMGEHVQQGSLVTGRYHNERFDFAVANGRALQLTQTWSFQIPNWEELAEQVKAWAWTVRDVREHGGMAEVAARKVGVDRDVSIRAVYVPPAADGTRQALDEALAAFREIGVQPVEVDRAQTVADEARRLLKDAAA